MGQDSKLTPQTLCQRSYFQHSQLPHKNSQENRALILELFQNHSRQCLRKERKPKGSLILLAMANLKQVQISFAKCGKLISKTQQRSSTQTMFYFLPQKSFSQKQQIKSAELVDKSRVCLKCTLQNSKRHNISIHFKMLHKQLSNDRD